MYIKSHIRVLSNLRGVLVHNLNICVYWKWSVQVGSFTFT